MSSCVGRFGDIFTARHGEYGVIVEREPLAEYIQVIGFVLIDSVLHCEVACDVVGKADMVRLINEKQVGMFGHGVLVGDKDVGERVNHTWAERTDGER